MSRKPVIEEIVVSGHFWVLCRRCKKAVRLLSVDYEWFSCNLQRLSIIHLLCAAKLSRTITGSLGGRIEGLAESLHDPIFSEETSTVRHFHIHHSIAGWVPNSAKPGRMASTDSPVQLENRTQLVPAT